MGDSQNRRVEVNANDYFSNQKRQDQMTERAATVNQPTDIGLGPGIAQDAVRITDYNDQLALYNGYYASDGGRALNAPHASQTTLTAALAAGSISSLPVVATTVQIPAGQPVVVSQGGASIAFVTSALVAVGATSIPVVAQTVPGSTYGIGSLVLSSEQFLGYTTSDSVFGGVQEFIGLTSRNKYRRQYFKNLLDPGDFSLITFGAWTSDERIAASAAFITTTSVSIPTSGVLTALPAPGIDTYGQEGTYQSVGTTIKILRQGVYTGYIKTGSSDSTIKFTGAGGSVRLTTPDNTGTRNMVLFGGNIGSQELYLPFTFVASDGNNSISLAVAQVSATLTASINGFQITRVGDAV